MKDHTRPEGLTPKQYLVWLNQNGLLTKLQLGAGGRMLDQLIAEGKGREKAVKSVLRALDKGKVKLGVTKDPQAQKNLPMLKDMPEHASPKQKLLELRLAGSISHVECRAAAEALDKGVTIEQALVIAGCERVLDTVPVPPKEPDETTDGDAPVAGGDTPGEPDTGTDGAAGSGPVDGEGDGGSGSEDDDSGADEKERPVTLAQVLKGNTGSVRAAVAKIKHMPSVLSLLELEARGDNRKGVKAFLQERLEASGAFDQGAIERAFAGDTGEGGNASDDHAQE